MGVTFPDGTSGPEATPERPGNLALGALNAPTALRDVGLRGSLVGALTQRPRLQAGAHLLTGDGATDDEAQRLGDSYRSTFTAA